MNENFATLKPILLSPTNKLDDMKKYYEENNLTLDNPFIVKFFETKKIDNTNDLKPEPDMLQLLSSTFQGTEYDTPVEAKDNPEYTNTNYNLPKGKVNEKAKRALTYFIGRGYSKAQASGIVGNLYAESGLNHTRPQTNNGPGFGYAQWENPRQADFKRVIGKNIRQSTEKDQLDFINWELNNTEKRAKQHLLQTKTPSEAAYSFANNFERMKKYNKEREAYAEQFSKLL